MSSAPHPSAPKIKRFPAAKQRRLDELLLRNSEGKLLPAERKRLESLVDEAERLMVANAKVLADFAACEKAAKPSTALPLTVWVTLESAQR